MEYILKIEEKTRYRVLWTGIIFTFLFIIFSVLFLGIYGFALSAGLLFFLLLTPLFYGRYKLFLFLWIFIVPIIELQRYILIGNINPFTYLITGLSFPFAIILFYKKIGIVLKALPFIQILLVFQILIFLNALRPDTPISSTFYMIRFHFIEMFIIFISFFYFKKNSPETIFKWINIFAVINAFAAVVQRLTGFGAVLIEGIPRVGALVGHPNTYALFINIYLPLGIYLFINSKTKQERIFYGICLALNVFALILTLSKGSLFIFMLMLMVLFLYLPAKIRLNLFLFSTVFLILFLVTTFLVESNLPEHIIHRLTDPTSLQWRFQHWSNLFSNFNLSALFVGNGIGSVERYSILLNPNQPYASHNLYIELLYDFGILGLIYYLNFFILAGKFLKNSFSNSHSDKYGYTNLQSNDNKAINKNGVWSRGEAPTQSIFPSHGGGVRGGAINNTLNTNWYYIIPFLVIFAILISAFGDTAASNRVNIYFAWIIITAFYMKLKL